MALTATRAAASQACQPRELVAPHPHPRHRPGWKPCTHERQTEDEGCARHEHRCAHVLLASLLLAWLPPPSPSLETETGLNETPRGRRQAPRGPQLPQKEDLHLRLSQQALGTPQGSVGGVGPAGTPWSPPPAPGWHTHELARWGGGPSPDPESSPVARHSLWSELRHQVPTCPQSRCPASARSPQLLLHPVAGRYCSR